MLDEMLRIRTIELEIARRYPEGKMRTPVHLSVGQEAAAVGVASALTSKDQAVSTHRSHAHYLAMGGNLKALIAELYGKADGCSHGHGGSMHLVDRSVGFMGSTSIVGGTVPIGVGLAWAKVLREEKGIVVVFHGDAAVEEGVWHESVNFAVLRKLPVLFVCEHNSLSCFTDISERQSRISCIPLATAHGIRAADRVDGRDPFAVQDVALDLRKKIIELPGPAFLEIETYRYLEHCGPNNDDHLKYRDLEFLEKWKSKDLLNGVRPSPDLLKEIEDAFEFAEKSQAPIYVGEYAY